MTIPELEMSPVRTSSREPSKESKVSADLDYDFSLLLDYDDIEYYNEIDNNMVKKFTFFFLSDTSLT